MAGTVLFGRYRLIAPAGSGGSAQVWHALDERTGERVAVKRLHPLVFADEAARHRLEREFRTLHALDDRHIVRVRDLLIGEREAALILDDVDGPSLLDVLRERRSAGEPGLDPATSVAIVEDVAAALAVAHAAGIVHRDVTPGNILLEPDGTARLTDFGIAQTDDDETVVTATGQVIGTLRFLAPEQLRGEPATIASDVHALAAVAYEMLAGRPAYDAPTPVALAEAHQAGPSPITGIPAALDAAVRRGLATDPAERPAGVRDFAAELRAALPGEPATAVTAAIPVVVATEPGRGAVATAARPERGRRSITSVPAPLVAVLGIALAAGLLLAATGADPSHVGTGPAASHATAKPTAEPTPTPTPVPVPPAPRVGPKGGDGGKGGGHGHGHGGGKGPNG